MYAKFMNLSFQTRLMMIFFTSALVPLMVLGVFTYQKSSEISKEQVSQQVLEGMTQINRNLTFFNQDIQQLSHFIYRSEIVHNALKKSKWNSWDIITIIAFFFIILFMVYPLFNIFLNSFI